MKIKDKILSETSEETKQKVRDIANKLVMKQETLAETAGNFWLNDDSISYNDRISYVNGFKKGAKWQQEQIGKSEFLQKLRGTLSDAEARRLIFKQFKKK
jgi:hypothetical protein